MGRWQMSNIKCVFWVSSSHQRGKERMNQGLAALPSPTPRETFLSHNIWAALVPCYDVHSIVRKRIMSGNIHGEPIRSCLFLISLVYNGKHISCRQLISINPQSDLRVWPVCALHTCGPPICRAKK